jgi:hypothetical protein
MKSLIAAAAALLMAAAPPAGPTETPQNVRLSSDPSQKKICHEVGELGSRLGTKRVCHTAKEEQEARMNRRQFVEEVQRGFSRCNLPDPGKC